jgi:hypothetical protein
MTTQEKIEKTIAILESSDIVWGRYGADTIERLAERIVNATEEEKPAW